MREARMLVSHVFGEASPYLSDLNRIEELDAQNSEPGSPETKEEFRRLYQTMTGDLEIARKLERRATSLPFPGTRKTKPNSNEVFVVHGHDEAMKQEVARVVERLGLKPIILHEQPDRSRTVIEKFVDYSNVGFAIVLLSPDDIGRGKSQTPDEVKPRARQNVILELGFFIGRLGREKVIAIHRSTPGFDMPSDYSGVLFKQFDPDGAWRIELVRELRAAGYDVDANRLTQ